MLSAGVQLSYYLSLDQNGIAFPVPPDVERKSAKLSARERRRLANLQVIHTETSKHVCIVTYRLECKQILIELHAIAFYFQFFFLSVDSLLDILGKLEKTKNTFCTVHDVPRSN